MLNVLPNMTLCTYRPLNLCVHQLTFKAPSALAIDQMFDHLSGVYQSSPSDEPVRLLLDIRQSGLLPMAYTAQKARRWLAARPKPQPTRIAFFYHKLDFPVEMVQTFFRLARLEMDYHMAFFPDQELEKALVWLVNADETVTLQSQNE